MTQFLFDDRLSLKEKGLAAMIYSAPMDAPSNIQFIKENSKDGADAIRTGLKRLKELGYLKTETYRDSTGKITRQFWKIINTQGE